MMSSSADYQWKAVSTFINAQQKFVPKLKTLLLHFSHFTHSSRLSFSPSSFSVSHTTDDLVFIWLPEDKVPLAVDTGIELPQLELISNVTGDCTSVYSTG